MGDIRVRAARQAAATGGGTQDWTVSGFGTPKAALNWYSNAVADGTPYRAGHRMGVGVTDFTNHRCVAFTASDNVPDSDTRRSAGATIAVVGNFGANSLDGQLDFDSLITDGWRGNWSNAPTDALFVNSLMFGGASLQAKVGDFTSSATLNDVVEITGLGFQPHLLLLISSNQSFAGNTIADAIQHLGIVSFNGTGVAFQGSWNRANSHNQPSSGVGAYPSILYALRHLTMSGVSVNLGEALEVTEATSDGFKVATRVSGASTHVIGYLALNFGPDHGYWAGMVDTPATAVTQNVESPAFHPQAVLQFGSRSDSTMDASDATLDAGMSMLGVATDSEEFSSGAVSQDNAATMEENSFANTKAIFGRAHNDAGGVTADMTLDDLGFDTAFTLVFSGGLTHIWYAAIERAQARATVAARAPAPDVSIDGTLTVQGTTAAKAAAAKVAIVGQLTLIGTIGMRAPAAELDATGTLAVQGTAAMAAPAPALDATGTLTVQGSVAIAAPPAALDSVGSLTVLGTAALELEAPSIDIVGDLVAPPSTVIGTIALAAPAAKAHLFSGRQGLAGSYMLRTAHAGEYVERVELAGSYAMRTALEGDYDMAVTGLVDSAYLNNAHVMGFTIAGVDLTGAGGAGPKVKLALCLIDPRTGRYDPTEPDLVKTTDNPVHFVLVNGPTGDIDFKIEPADTAPGTEFGAGDYAFQVEVFDNAGGNGVVVSDGVITFAKNIGEGA